MATVVITDKAAAEVAALPVPIQVRVAKVVRRLERWPHVSGYDTLKGPWAGHFKIRTGDYRVIFQVSGGDDARSTGPAKKKARVPRWDDAESVVTIVKVGHRSTVYGG